MPISERFDIVVEFVGAIDLNLAVEGWHPARAHVLCCVFGCTVPIVDTLRHAPLPTIDALLRHRNPVTRDFLELYHYIIRGIV